MIKLSNIFTCLVFIVMASPYYGHAQTVISAMESNQELSSFVEAIKDTELEEKLSEPGAFTIFAPTNNAFDSAVGTRQNFQNRMESFLLNHIMTGWASSRNLKIMEKATSMGGIQLHFEGESSVSVNGISIITANIRADNGVIHIIDGALE